MKQKFIITQDEQTANLLLTSGFKLIKQSECSYTFLNDAPQNFNLLNLIKVKLHIQIF